MAPNWWYQLSGVFFGLFIVFVLVGIWLLIALISVMRGISDQLNELKLQVKAIGTKVESLVDNVNVTSKALGSRADNVGSNLESFSSSLAQKADIVAMVLMGLQLVSRLRKK